MNINTNLGCLEARVLDDPLYPGIAIGLNRNGNWIQMALVEVDQSEEDPWLKVHAYSISYDEPIFDGSDDVYAVNKCFKK